MSRNSDGELFIKAFTVASYTVMAGYLAVEYIYPYIKKRFFSPHRSLLKKLGINENLNSYELELLNGLINDDDDKPGFESIGGLTEQIELLKTNLMLFTKNNSASSSISSLLLKRPNGVLFYGPPGCGKTILAKALAYESNFRFLTISLATILDKWFGESEKYVEAIFTLAKKLSPCIVFIDEIDSLTRRRGDFFMASNESLSNLKSQFLSLWGDDLEDVIILGATNRRQDIDEAFLRRMPLQIEFDLPDLYQREQIFQVILKDSQCENNIDWYELAEISRGFSGSIIKESCRRAAISCFQRNSPSITMNELRNAIGSIQYQK